MYIYMVHNYVCIGNESSTMNIHMLRHLPHCTYNWGPIWGYCLFWFENLNGMLKKLVHGTRQVCSQVCTAHSLKQYRMTRDIIHIRWQTVLP